MGRGRRSEEHRNHRVPTRAAADRSVGGGPPSRSPRLTVMGDLEEGRQKRGWGGRGTNLVRHTESWENSLLHDSARHVIAFEFIRERNKRSRVLN